MSSIGEKIKEVFSGHHHESYSNDVKTPDVNAPGAYPTDPEDEHTRNKLTKEAPPGRGNRDSAIDMAPKIQSPTKQPHVDPETETKQATSAAGNYPYWGDLPTEKGAEGNLEDATAGFHGDDQHRNTGHQGDNDKGAVGNKNASIGAESLSHMKNTSLDNKITESTPNSTTFSSGSTAPHPSAPLQEDVHKKDHSGLEKGALAAGAAAGAGFLAHRHKDDKPREAETTTSGNKSSTAGPFQKEIPEHITAKPSVTDNASTTAQVDPLEYPPRYDQGHGNYGKDFAGAGLAGAAGLGYLANKRHGADTKGDIKSDSGPTPASSSRIASSTDDQRYDTAAHQNAQQANSNSVPQDPHSSGPNAGEYHNYKKEEALAGAAGLGAGAGHLAHNTHHSSRPDERPSTISPSSAPRETSAGGLASTTPYTGGGVHNTVVGAGSPEDAHTRRFPLNSSSNDATIVGPQHGTGSGLGQQDVTRDIGAPNSGHEREKQALAAAAGVGAGAGLAHHHHKGKPVGMHDHRDQSDAASGSGHSPPAQAAAQQAWTKQDPATATHSHPSHNDRHDGLQSGIAGAGATAAYYGQGREHDQNPRSGTSEKIADRALGNSYESAPVPTSAPGGAQTISADSTSRSTGGQHSGAKVLHKCHQCGADNDITNYFNKDASFRIGS